jgi:transcriptional regulator
MYTPAHFREDRLPVLHDFIRKHPFATVVTSGDGLAASHVPLLLDVTDGLTALRGHLARANPQLQVLDGGAEVLAVFHGPQFYVSPSWYVEKERNGRVVPTWNYIAVHAYGRASVIRDRGEIVALVRELTDAHEAAFDKPWSVDDAPPEFIDSMLGAIVGFRIEVTRLEGKWKLSQNRPADDRASVIEALRAMTGQ